MSAPSASNPSPASPLAFVAPTPGDIAALVCLQMALSFVGSAVLAMMGSGAAYGFTGVGILVGAQAWAGMKEKRSAGRLVPAFRARVALIAAVVHTVLGVIALGIFTSIHGSAGGTFFLFATLFGFAFAYAFTRLGLRLGTPKTLR